MALKLLRDSPYKAIKQEQCPLRRVSKGYGVHMPWAAQGKTPQQHSTECPSSRGLDEAVLLHAKLRRIACVSSLTELKRTDKHNAIIS